MILLYLTKSYSKFLNSIIKYNINDFGKLILYKYQYLYKGVYLCLENPAAEIVKKQNVFLNT